MAKQQKEKGFDIEWSDSASRSFVGAVEYISEFSLKGAEGVVTSIFKLLERAAINPEINPPDKWKTNNDGSYRAFEVKKFRIAYKIYSAEKMIRIIYLRHVRQYPHGY